jgi:hypothetical protein
MSNDPKQLRNESVVSARACISISFPVICKIKHGGVHEAVVMFSMFPINRRCRSERDEILHDGYFAVQQLHDPALRSTRLAGAKLIPLISYRNPVNKLYGLNLAGNCV